MRRYQPISGPKIPVLYPDRTPVVEMLSTVLEELKKHVWMNPRAHVQVKNQFYSTRKTGRSSLTMDIAIFEPNTNILWAIIWTKGAEPSQGEQDRQIKRSREIGVPVYLIWDPKDLPALINDLRILSFQDFFEGL